MPKKSQRTQLKIRDAFFRANRALEPYLDRTVTLRSAPFSNPLGLWCGSEGRLPVSNKIMNKRLCLYLPPNKPDLHRILPSSRHSQLRPVRDVVGGRANEWVGGRGREGSQTNAKRLVYLWQSSGLPALWTRLAP